MAVISPTFRRSLRRLQLRNIRSLATATDGRQQSFGNRVRIVEVGPRDGLQNEKKTIPVATKIDLIERLAKTGLSTIEAGSFVSPKWVPQVGHITSHPSTKLPHLAPGISYSHTLSRWKLLARYLSTS